MANNSGVGGRTGYSHQNAEEILGSGRLRTTTPAIDFTAEPGKVPYPRVPWNTDRHRRNWFEMVVLPHLDAAYNLARWITGNAEDVVQEAMVRAITYFPSFRGQNARAWLLKIVRNMAYSALRARRGLQFVPLAEGCSDGDNPVVELADPGDDPEAALIRARGRQQVDALIAGLPLGLRETLVMRELEELSYREIAEVTDVPIGTVMSRLHRARSWLLRASGA